MTGSLLSPLWYRVAGLRPRLKPHLQLHRHHYRGQVWFVLHDPGSGRSHRFTPGARLVLNGMDGHRRMDALWAAAQRQLGEGAPTQDELINLLGQLHDADLMQCDVTPDAAELFQRSQRQSRAKARQAFGNPMALKLPLFDPHRLLDALVVLLRPLWNRWGALLWLCLVGSAGLLALGHRAELSANVADRVLAAHNLVLLGLLFPLIKLLHELGHGVAARMRGGEVHEIGVMLLVFMPVPYVDASSASTFRSRWDRAVVGAAGMGVELALAALAMFVWLAVEPGLVRSLAFNTMLLAGLSTLVFNGNPLLRYDGYYMLADLLEMPNLAGRANRYIGHLVERFAFGLHDTDPQANGTGERVWLAAYAIASYSYRMAVAVAIVLFIAGQFFVVGVVLALWAAGTMILLPAWRTLALLVRAPRLAPVRGRAYGVSAALAVVLVLALFVLPAPLRTRAEGVVWLPEQALVRAGGAGFVSQLLVAPGSLVAAGTPVAALSDPWLDAQLRVAQARQAELQARFDALFVADRAQAEQLRGPLARAAGEVLALKDRLQRLVLTSPSAGRFLVPQAPDLPGRLLRQGDLLGHVIQPSTGDTGVGAVNAVGAAAATGAGAGAGPGFTTEGRSNAAAAPSSSGAVVRVVVQQADIDLVRQDTRAVWLKPAWAPERSDPARVLREVPAGAAELPSRALTTAGGGQLAADPRDQHGLRTLERSFQFDINLPLDLAAAYGARVHVRFDHGQLPLALQWGRSLRQLLLSRLAV